MNPLWLEMAARAQRELTDEQAAKLSAYLDLLIETNKTMNLTRIVDRDSAERLHIADALTLLEHLPRHEHRLVDVGSGGGVPGIPLAIARPDATVLLVESTKKKAIFLENAVERLGLKNVSVSQWRAEEVARSNSRESFDIATARAVGAMDLLAEWCLPLVRVGGRMLAMKGERIKAELPLAGKAIKWVGGGPAKIHPAHLPGADHHVIVEIHKVARTDKAYPRSVGDAKGKPIR